MSDITSILGSPSRVGMPAAFGDVNAAAVSGLGPVPSDVNAAAVGGMNFGGPDGKMMPRMISDVPPATRALVAEKIDMIKAAKHFHKPAIDTMREDMKFAAGDMWAIAKNGLSSYSEEAYTANLVLSHLRNRTASLYARNPTAVAKVRERLRYPIWDGKAETLEVAKILAQSGDPFGAQIVAEAQAGLQEQLMMTKLGKTLELLFKHSMTENFFKLHAKQLIRRVLTCGVGYIKIGYQFPGVAQPDSQAMEDDLKMMARFASIMADIHDGEADLNSARGAEMAIMQKRGLTEVGLREGVVYNFPAATALIIDPACRYLKGFIGARWVAEEFGNLTVDMVKDIFGVDVGASALKSSNNSQNSAPRSDGWPKNFMNPAASNAPGAQTVTVWQLLDKGTGIEYWLCDGHPDFLRPPAAPLIAHENFFPWTAISFNDIEHDEQLFPPSDVRLMVHPQAEYNRSREALRQHRIANRPKYVSAAGKLEDEDLKNLSSANDHDIIGIVGMSPGDRVQDLFQAVQHAPIDASVYSTDYVNDDIERVVGSQSADLGAATGDTTATEASIAASSRSVTTSSQIDDVDEFLTTVARNASQIMLAHMSRERVAAVVGPGAVWPEFSRAEIREEVYLEIQAASSGRPNKAADLANFERVLPFVMQIPGINPIELLKELLRRLDDQLDIERFIIPQGLSITAQNSAMGTRGEPGAVPPGAGPEAQGPAGAAGGQPAQGRARAETPEGGPQAAMPPG